MLEDAVAASVMCRCCYLGPSKRRYSVKIPSRNGHEDNTKVHYLTEPLILARSVSKAIGIKKEVCITEEEKTYLETVLECVNSAALQLTQSGVLIDEPKAASKDVDLSQVFLASWLGVENVL